MLCYLTSHNLTENLKITAARKCKTAMQMLDERTYGKFNPQKKFKKRYQPGGQEWKQNSTFEIWIAPYLISDWKLLKTSVGSPWEASVIELERVRLFREHSWLVGCVLVGGFSFWTSSRQAQYGNPMRWRWISFKIQLTRPGLLLFVTRHELYRTLGRTWEQLLAVVWDLNLDWAI